MNLDTDLALIARACGADGDLTVNEEWLQDDIRTLFGVWGPENQFVLILRYFAQHDARGYNLLPLAEFVDIGDPTAVEAIGTWRHIHYGQKQYLWRGAFFFAFDLAACRAMLRTLLRIRRHDRCSTNDWDGIVRRWCEYVALRELDLIVPPPPPKR